MFTRRLGNRNPKKPLAGWQSRREFLPENALKSENSRKWMELLEGYITRSHIHGLYLLFLPTMRRRMRILWTLALIFAFYVLIYVSYLLGHRYHNKQFQTIVANSHASIRHIAFPVIIICNRNRLNWSRLPEIKKRYHIPPEREELFERILTGYDSLSFTKFNVFSSLKGEHLEDLNYLNFTDIVAEMAWRCDEMFSECIWQRAHRDCCALFRPRRLTLGYCLAFNELEQRRGTETGISTGLLVQLMLREEDHAPGNPQPKGFLLSVVESSVWFGFPIDVWPHTRTNVAVTAVYHYFDDSTLSLPSSYRRCVTDYEEDSEHFQTLEGQKYMLENCQAECQQRYLLRYCNCTLDLFYPPSGYRACRATDLPCLAEHNHLLQNFEQSEEHPYVHREESGLVCDCLNNCKSLTLLTDLRKSILKPWWWRNYTRSEGMWLNVYFKKPSMLVYKTNLIYTWVDLIVSFGGICQLCLGCSIISIIEFIYFAAFKVPQFYWRARKNKVQNSPNILTVQRF